MSDFPQCGQGQHPTVFSEDDAIEHLEALQKEAKSGVVRIDVLSTLDQAFRDIHERQILKEEVLVLRPDQVKRVRAFIHDLRSQ